MDRSVNFTFLSVVGICGILLLIKAFEPAKVEVVIPKVTVQPVKKPEIPKPQIRINGPQEGLINKEIEFTANNLGVNDKEVEWSFGESGRIDSRNLNPRYKYSKEGTYTITLHVANHPDVSSIISISKPSAPVVAAKLCPDISKSELQNIFQQFFNASNDGTKAELKRQLQSYFSNLIYENVINDATYRSSYSFNSWFRMAEYDNVRGVRVQDISKNSSNCITFIQIESRK